TLPRRANGPRCSRLRAPTPSPAPSPDRRSRRAPWPPPTGCLRWDRPAPRSTRGSPNGRAPPATGGRARALAPWRSSGPQPVRRLPMFPVPSAGGPAQVAEERCSLAAHLMAQGPRRGASPPAYRSPDRLRGDEDGSILGHVIRKTRGEERQTGGDLVERFE